MSTQKKTTHKKQQTHEKKIYITENNIGKSQKLPQFTNQMQETASKITVQYLLFHQSLK